MRAHTIAVTTGSVSHKPTSLPTIAAMNVRKITFARSPTISSDMVGSRSIFSRSQTDLLISADPAMPIINIAASQRRVASCRALRSCHSSIIPPESPGMVAPVPQTAGALRANRRDTWGVPVHRMFTHLLQTLILFLLGFLSLDSPFQYLKLDHFDRSTSWSDEGFCFQCLVDGYDSSDDSL